MANNITLSYPSAFYHQFLDKNGKPLTGGKLYTYSAGTSTSIPTYKTIGDTSSTNTNTNPIILDNAGVAHIVIETDKAYKFVLFDKNDAKIDEWDNVTGNIGGGGGSSEDIVVVGTPNEIDVSGSVTQGVKRYVISLSNSVKSTILYLVGLYNNVLNSLGNKADKVQGATAGNLAALDANGNLTDSGKKAGDFEPSFSVLPISKGGTGKTTGKAATNNLFSDINSVNTDPDDTARIVFKYGSPSDSNGIFFARAITSLWNYIKSKISSVLGLSENGYTGNAATATSATTASNYASGGGIDTALQGKLGTSGDGSNVSVTPDGSSSGTDIGSSTTLKAWAQKFKNLVGSLKALAFKDKASYSDLSSGVQSSLDKADTALQYNSTSQSSGSFPLLVNDSGTGKYNSDITLDIGQHEISGVYASFGSIDVSESSTTSYKSLGTLQSINSSNYLSMLVSSPNRLSNNNTVSTYLVEVCNRQGVKQISYTLLSPEPGNTSADYLAEFGFIADSNNNMTIVAKLPPYAGLFSVVRLNKSNYYNGSTFGETVSDTSGYTSGTRYEIAHKTGSYPSMSVGTLRVERIANTTDANSLTAQYSARIFEEAGVSGNHMPEPNDWWHVLSSMGADTNYATQLAIPMTGEFKRLAVRKKLAGTWTSWLNLAYVGDIPAVINNLTSDSTTNALSAAQGKALNESKLNLLSNVYCYQWLSASTTITLPSVRKIMSLAFEWDNNYRDIQLLITNYFYGGQRSESILVYIGWSANGGFQNSTANVQWLSLASNQYRLQVLYNIDTTNHVLEIYLRYYTGNNYGDTTATILGCSRFADINGTTRKFTDDMQVTLPASAVGAVSAGVIKPYGGAGSKSIPVYVKADGSFDSCDPSQMNVGNANKAAYAAYAPMQEYDYGSIYQYGTWESGQQTYPIYHVHQLKNHAINRIGVKNLQNTTCNLIIELPNVEESGATLDFIVEFGWYSNNANIVCGLLVEGCKPVLLFDGYNWYSDANFHANPQGFKQIVIVRGDTYEVRRVSTT